MRKSKEMRRMLRFPLSGPVSDDRFRSGEPGSQACAVIHGVAQNLW
ncbi:MAG: hypothetical protein ACLT9P_08165 [Evtepia gabavorous]